MVQRGQCAAHIDPPRPPPVPARAPPPQGYRRGTARVGSPMRARGAAHIRSWRVETLDRRVRVLSLPRVVVPVADVSPAAMPALCNPHNKNDVFVPTSDVRRVLRGLTRDPNARFQHRGPRLKRALPPANQPQPQASILREQAAPRDPKFLFPSTVASRVGASRQWLEGVKKQPTLTESSLRHRAAGLRVVRACLVRACPFML
ncbi:hypothetical protein HETIRDRAFT_447538 [Heterobasidion irregulare TC 32-1]|uniref:Uncharacterized protein n=1 Tax=Heterobasidion irregulare (strain TC 32-1) TaxID=747525 RepID=W4KM62_HETIT|nr:uncharacterized protein HETIRDRAFT_447538 [Heterobasidion irregulare TC 32-1]ETW86897.1 hypothetical protein HETIRDRAFT_447538 [Heterobasidion irregulare TC 32-1]